MEGRREAMLALTVVSVSWSGGSTTAAAAIQSEHGWEDVGTFDRGGIDNIVGRHKALDGLDCLEASASTTLPAALLKELITDIPSNLQWSSADLVASVVLDHHDGGLDYYQVLNLPLPLADRFWFLRGTVSESGPVWLFSWERIDADEAWAAERSSLLVEYPGAIEIGVNVGSWALIEAPFERVVRFRSCTDVGGSVPRWAGEKAARLMLPNNIVDLLQEGQRRTQ